METLVNHSNSALLQAKDLNGGVPIQMRQAVYDTRGHVAELFTKAIRNGGLEKEMSLEDRGRMMAGLASWGALKTGGGDAARRARIGMRAPRGVPDAPKTEKGDVGLYAANSESGWITPPGAGPQIGVAREPLPMSTLMHPIVGVGSTFHEYIDMQATMLQPVGGMDAIPHAFEAKLGPVVRKGCVVTKIARKGGGVEVAYREGGQAKAIAADYCLVTIPLSVLKAIPADLSPDRKAAIDRAEYRNSIKVAFQSPRFWETDRPDLRRPVVHRPRHLHHLVPERQVHVAAGGAGGGLQLRRGRRPLRQAAARRALRLCPRKRWSGCTPAAAASCIRP